jgi:glucose-like phosphotransferase system IIB component
MTLEKANAVIVAYGGIANITDVGACFTKLRISVADVKKVDQAKLKNLGAHGVIQPSANAVYAVFGTEADILKNMINEIISKNAQKT